MVLLRRPCRHEDAVVDPPWDSHGTRTDRDSRQPALRRFVARVRADVARHAPAHTSLQFSPTRLCAEGTSCPAF